MSKLIFGLVIGLGSLVSASAGETSVVLDSPVKEVLIYRGSELAFCAKVKIPCGWEYARGEVRKSDFKSRVVVESGTIRTVLDSIIAKNPKYIWELNDGVINFRPKPEFQASFDGVAVSSLTIKKLSLKNQKINVAVRRVCKAAGLKCKGVGSGGGRSSYGKVSVELPEVTLNSALNELVRADGESAWTLMQSESGDEFIAAAYSWRKGPSLFK